MLRGISSKSLGLLSSLGGSLTAGATTGSHCLPAAAATLREALMHTSNTSSSNSSSSSTCSGVAQHDNWQQQPGALFEDQQQGFKSQVGSRPGLPSRPAAAAALSQAPQLWQHLYAQQQPQQQQQLSARLQPQQHGQQQQALMFCRPLRQQLAQCQQQQQRGLLGVSKAKNYQEHNKKKPQKYKMKTPPIARRRVVVGEDGVMWRMQAGRRHKRYKKSKLQLLGLKGLVPLHGPHAARLRKLGFKKTWWYNMKA